MKINTILTFLAVAGFTTASNAASIFSDDFNYPDGAIVGAASSPWLNNSGTTPMMVSNNTLVVSTSRSEDIAAQLSGSPYLTNGSVAAVYSKFTVKFTGLPTALGTYFAHFNGETPPPSASLHRARIWVSGTNAIAGTLVPAGKFRLGIVNSSTGNASTAQWDADLDTNVTYTVVTRLHLADGISTLWIDPVDESSASVTAADAISPLINAVYYSFRQATGEGTMLIDNLRIGTAFADVAGADTAPAISALPAQSIARDATTGALPFTVGDAESNPATLTVTTASTNTTVVPLSGIVVNNGDGTNRTVTVTPAAGQQGRSLVTLTVSDGVNSASASFLVTVGAPSISVIPNQVAKINSAVAPIAFTVTDAEGDALTASATSSNPNILQNANITVSPSGSSRTVTVVPQPNTNGFTIVTLSFSDGFNTTTRSFALSISPELGVLLQDQFNYTSFILPNALYQATDSPWQTASGTAYELQTTNGWAYINPALSEDLGAPLTNTALGLPFPAFTNYPSSDGVVFYSSFTLKATSLPKFAGDYFAHLKSTYNSTTFRAKVFVATNGASANSYRIGIANQGNLGTYFPSDCSLDTDYLVVTRYNSAVGEATLWVNPASETSASVTGADAPQTTPIGAYGLRQTGGTTSVGDTGDLQISNLVVSTSFPALPSVAPVTITGISVVSGTVTISFDAGAADSIASFSLFSSGAIDGTYASAAGAAISSVGTGQFQATVPVNGDAQFYRIHRP